MILHGKKTVCEQSGMCGCGIPTVFQFRSVRPVRHYLTLDLYDLMADIVRASLSSN